MVEKTKKWQVVGLRKTANVHSVQEYELRLFDNEKAEPGYKGLLVYGSETKMRAALKQLAEPEARINMLFAEA